MSHLLGDVQAKSVHDVSEEEQVDLAFAIPVVDVADVLNLCLINLKNREWNEWLQSVCAVQSNKKVRRLLSNWE